MLTRTHDDQAQLPDELSRLHLLHAVARAMDDRHDLPAIFQAVLRHLEQDLPVDFGCVFVCEPGADALRVAAIGTRSAVLAGTLGLSEHAEPPIAAHGLARSVGGGLLYEPHTRALNLAFAQRCASAGLQALVLAPLQADKGVFGVLAAARRDGESFSRAECELLRQLGEQLARAARQAQLHDALQRADDDLRATAALVNQLRRTNEELEVRVRERTHELQIAQRDLEAFSYSVSHDLREPLRAVEGFCEMFRSEFAAAVPAAGQKILERIWSGASRMSQLLDDLLHFARFSRQPLERGRVALRDLVLDVAARVTEPLGACAPSVHVAELADCYGDRALLEQVLINLLSNACKFTAARPAARVEVGVLRQGQEQVYYVRDNGVGFDMRYADKLFGVFQRFHPPNAYEGTGIGLAIVHRIITRHGGRVWADSRPQEGSTFFFCLPGPPGALPGAGRAVEHTI